MFSAPGKTSNTVVSICWPFERTTVIAGVYRWVLSDSGKVHTENLGDEVVEALGITRDKQGAQWQPGEGTDDDEQEEFLLAVKKPAIGKIWTHKARSGSWRG